MVRRACVAAIAGFTLSAGAGCHIGPQPRPIRPEPPIIRRDPVATKFIEQHNRNAAAITSLRAEPSVQVTAEQSGRVSGQLALERDRYFCLDLYMLGHHKASIGSNPDEFWFWIDADKGKAINFCRYSDVGRSDLYLSYQPDWIMEAMGLRPISVAEARTIAVREGDQPDTMILTQTRKDLHNQTYTKETVVKESTGRILEHHLWLGVKQQLLASAKISSYAKTPIGTSTGDPDAAPSEADFAYIPDKFRLEWVGEKIALDINLRPARGVFKVNPSFTEKERTAMFSEPNIAGTVRRDLARFDGDPAAPASGGVPETQVRETRPIPNRGITLGNPIPDGAAPGVGVGGSPDGAVRTSIEPEPAATDSGTPDASTAPTTAPRPTGWRSRSRLFGPR